MFIENKLLLEVDLCFPYFNYLLVLKDDSWNFGFAGFAVKLGYQKKDGNDENEIIHFSFY